MADFEGSASLSQSGQSASATGTVINPGGTQSVGLCIGIGNVINTGTAAVAQLVASVASSGTVYDFSGQATLSQGVGAVSAAGSSGPSIQANITQSGQWVASAGTIMSSGSVTPALLSAQQSVTSAGRDIQLPRIPTSVPKDAQDWFIAAQKIIEKYIFGRDGSRLVSANDLVKAGVVDRDGPYIRPPSGNLTTPPKVTDMRADGALALIIISWRNPVFPNYSHTELWRASVDDVGQAVKIQETAVESYVDMVGSGSTKYYWARAVSTAGVRGDFNASAGTKGATGYDPTYVRDLMTSSTWKPVTPYGAYQYVRPTTPNGYQYACIDGGRTAGDEPTWPTSVGDTVSDGDIVWQCVAADARVPFVIGTDPGGNPAVYIDTAYIEDATITSAKIGDLVADKITTGNLLANVQLLSKLWAGFSEYGNPDDDAGFWIGMDGGSPRLHINTGLSGGSRYLRFDGENIEMNVDILSGADISADDLTADSATLTRAEITNLSIRTLVTPSDWIDEADPPITPAMPEYDNFLCYASGCRKTASWSSGRLILGTGYSRPFAFFQTGYYAGVVPYDYSDSSTKYRCKTKAVAMRIKVTAQHAHYVFSGDPYTRSYMTVYILNQWQSLSSSEYNAGSATSGVPSTYLAKIELTGGADTIIAKQNTGSGDVDAFEVFSETTASGSVLLAIEDDQESLGYVSGQSLRFAVVYKIFYQAGGSDDDTIYGTIAVDAQIDTLMQLDVADNDDSL
jgi:hypothetical protein